MSYFTVDKVSFRFYKRFILNYNIINWKLFMPKVDVTHRGIFITSALNNSIKNIVIDL